MVGLRAESLEGARRTQSTAGVADPVNFLLHHPSTGLIFSGPPHDLRWLT